MVMMCRHFLTRLQAHSAGFLGREHGGEVFAASSKVDRFFSSVMVYLLLKQIISCEVPLYSAFTARNNKDAGSNSGTGYG